jgi:hypothetical protein
MNEDDKLLKAVILFVMIIFVIMAFIMTFFSYKISEDVKNIRYDIYELRARHQWPNLFPPYRPEDERTPK